MDYFYTVPFTFAEIINKGFRIEFFAHFSPKTRKDRSERPVKCVGYKYFQ